MTNISNDTKKIIQAVKAGGEIIKKYYAKSPGGTEKETLIQNKNKAFGGAEEIMIKTLQSSLPNYNIVSKETVEINKSSEFTLYIDPLDGTNNFMLGMPQFSTSVALVKKDTIIASAIYSPIMDSLFYAEKDKGAYENDKRIKISKESEIKKATICYNRSFESFYGDEVHLNEDLYKKGAKRFMVNWAPAIDFCMLASGRLEAVISNNSDYDDFLAGKLLAREAGAKITTWQGEKEKNDLNKKFIATNGTKVHEEIIKILGKNN